MNPDSAERTTKLSIMITPIQTYLKIWFTYLTRTNFCEQLWLVSHNKWMSNMNYLSHTLAFKLHWLRGCKKLTKHWLWSKVKMSTSNAWTISSCSDRWSTLTALCSVHLRNLSGLSHNTLSFHQYNPRHYLHESDHRSMTLLETSCTEENLTETRLELSSTFKSSNKSILRQNLF